MKRVLLGTNWKMHKTAEEAVNYTKELKELSRNFESFEIFIIPPYTDLWEVKKIVKDSSILLGAQNMHWEAEGAYTGEISPKMLKEIGIDIIELGHSERRQYYNETDFTVNKKVLAALNYGMIPLICVGEKLEDKEYGVSKEILSKQVKLALNGVLESQVSKIWIAYEPVWAIGEQGIPAEPSYIGEIHTHIRNILIELYGENSGTIVPILYGGSVNIDNSVAFIKQPNVDGLFIGRSAWMTENFHNIMLKISDAL
ncbi:MAG: triose-phosphate isomerase [Ruminiclostridium sp.]